MLRPLKAINLIHERMGAALADATVQVNPNPPSFVVPITPEQQRHDAALHEHVRSDVEGVVCAALEADRSPEAVVKLAADASNAAERLTRAVPPSDSPPVACQSGCAWCCHRDGQGHGAGGLPRRAFLESAELPVPRPDSSSG